MFVIETLLRIVANLEPFQLVSCSFPDKVVVGRSLVVKIILHDLDPSSFGTRTPRPRTSLEHQTLHEPHERIRYFYLVPAKVLKVTVIKYVIFGTENDIETIG